MQAVTRVNPAQAPKVKMWTPTRLNYGEGWHLLRKQPTRARGGVYRGSGNGMGAWFSGQRGRPTRGERSRRSTAAEAAASRGCRRGS